MSNSNRSYLSSLSQFSSRDCRALILINTKVKNPAAIERATRQDVTSVVFKHETSTADSILNDISENLPNKTSRLTSVACLLHVSGSAIYAAAGESGLRLSAFEAEDKIEIGDRAVHFFYNLVKNFMQDTPVIGIKPRVDFFMLDVLTEARKIIKVLEQKVNSKLKSNYNDQQENPKEVNFVCNINTGQTLSDPEQETFLDSASFSSLNHSTNSDSKSNKYQHLQSTVAAIYFRPDKLKSLAQNLLSRSNYQSQSSMDAFEKIKKVGQGAYGTAVLYKRKDDGNHVMGRKKKFTRIY